MQDENLDVSSELKQVLQWRNDQNDNSSTTASYEHLSRFYEKRDKVKAIDYAEKWLETGEVNNNLQAKIDALKQLGEKTISWNDLNPEKKFVVYRVLQEIMMNMKKHSRALLVALVFTEEEKHLKINYSDNGEGTTSQAVQNGNGLQNVKNRIFSVNGKLSFDTEKGKGMKIMILIPA